MSDRRVKYIILASIIFVGIVGISQGQGLSELNDVIPVTSNTSFGYLGHVTAILKDPDGNIQAYYQTDNDVMDRGANCGSDLVFDTLYAGNTCNFVQYMAIGSSTAVVLATQEDLFDKTLNGNELATLFSVTSAADGPGIAVDLELRHSFTITGADDGIAIGEAGIFDSATEATANIFARTLIGPFSMVSSGSTIDVEWIVHLD